MGLKLASFYPANEGTAVPTPMAMVLLFRPETEEPLAVMDGQLITEIRTAAGPQKTRMTDHACWGK